MIEAILLCLVAVAALALAYRLWRRASRRGRPPARRKIDLLKRD